MGLLKNFSLILFMGLMNLSSSLAMTKSYVGHRLIRIEELNAETNADVAFLLRHELAEIWRLEQDQLELAVQPQHLQKVLEMLIELNIPYELLREDLQSRIDHSMRYSLITKNKAKNDFDFLDFYNQTAIDNYVISLAEMDHASTEVIGYSYEGRQIRMLKICKNRECGTKPSFWMDATIHAREWVTAPAALYTATQLLTNDTNDFIDSIDFYIVPLLNPDGYQFSIDQDRMWRKTRSINDGSECIGTDANRNFVFQWATVGSSDDPCSNTFHGPSSFSEQETQVVKNFFEQNKNLEFKAFLTMHSIGQLVLQPWGYTQNESPDHEQLFDLGIKAGDAAEFVQGNFYRAGSSACLLYLSSGTIRDWAKGSLEIKYSYTIELTKERVLPPQKILGAVQEGWAIVEQVARQVVIEGSNKTQ